MEISEDHAQGKLRYSPKEKLCDAADSWLNEDPAMTYKQDVASRTSSSTTSAASTHSQKAARSSKSSKNSNSSKERKVNDSTQGTTSCSSSDTFHPNVKNPNSTDENCKMQGTIEGDGLAIASAHSEADILDKFVRNFKGHASGQKGNAHGTSKKDAVDEVVLSIKELRAQGLEPNTASYSQMVNTLVQEKKLDEAAFWLREMLAKGLKPSAASCNSVVNACASASKVDEAIFWLKEMERMRLQPEVVTYSTIVNACTKAKKIDEADYWLKEMQANALKTWKPRRLTRTIGSSILNPTIAGNMAR